MLAALVACALGLVGRPVAASQATLSLGSGARLAADDHRPLPAVAPPNDPLFRYQYNLAAIGIPQAWAISRGAGAVVAVLDTGVAFRDRGPYRRAPDLAGTRILAGRDFVDEDPHPDDVAPRDGRRSHGTQMAGIIAQTTGNGIGGAGVAPAAALMPVRVLEPDLTGSARAIARGLRFAADHGADVVNLSVAGPSATPVLTRAIDYATAKGVTIVAAAGNDGSPSVSWPAADPRVVAVGAVDRSLKPARYSNYGPKVDLVAPAGAGDVVDTGRGPADGVLAQTLEGGPSKFCYCFTASTSAAAAQVSGVAALLIGSRRARTPAEVRAALRGGARDLGPRGEDPHNGAGLVQARRALLRAGAGRGAASSTSMRPQGSAGGASPTAWVVLSLVVACLVALVVLGVASRRGRHAR